LGNSQTAAEALTAAVKEALQAFFVDGMGKAFDIAQASPAINDFFNHGRTEAASSLFNGTSNAFIMYQRGSHDQPANDNQAETLGVAIEPQEMKQSRGLHL
jgi:hypothetical protein